ncbi:MAG: type II secretion system F family protein [Phycisphaerae bacterium]|nr:type II secretion system F family protein [Phycisphaerae bacterium]
MSRFTYVARDNAGKSITGTLTAVSPAAAGKQLRDEGKFPVRIAAAPRGAPDAAPPVAKAAPPKAAPVAKPAAAPAAKPAAAPSAKPATTPVATAAAAGPTAATGTQKLSTRRISTDDIIFLTTQLAVMTETGVPLADALDAIREQSNSAKLQAMLNDIAERVKSGEEFSASLARHEKVFSTMYIAMVKAAEASGTLGIMLDRVAEYLVDEQETRKKIKGAMTYPCVMIFFAVAVTVFLMAFVLPKFTGIYASRAAALPLPTKFIMAISNVFVYHWLMLILGTTAISVSSFLFLRSERGKDWWADAVLKMPLIGGMVRKMNITRCLRTLGTLIGTGVSMLDAVQITRQIVVRGPFARLWGDVDAALRDGLQLSDPLLKTNLIPRSVSQMITAGEKTGKLAEVMEKVAAFCDRDMKSQIKTATAMIEPIMIAVMGIIIGTVVMALLLPIFNISKVMTQTPGGG